MTPEATLGCPFGDVGGLGAGAVSFGLEVGDFAATGGKGGSITSASVR